jgi:CRP-like cAMP-binding protein
MYMKPKVSSTAKEISALFHLNRQQTRVADQMFTSINVEAGQALAWEGSNTRQLVLILEGEVEVTKAGVHVATLAAGDVLGEITALGITSEQTASATATMPTRIAVAGHSDLGHITECVALHLKLQSTASRRLVAKV